MNGSTGAGNVPRGTPLIGKRTRIGTGSPPPRILRQGTVQSHPEIELPSLRYILLNMIEEYARHNGHADLIRESVDGLVGQDPPG
jgi:hypothetical protein